MTSANSLALIFLVLFFCLPLNLFSQNGLSEQEQYDHALQSFYENNFEEAEEKFNLLAQRICESEEYIRLCVETKINQIKVGRRLDKKEGLWEVLDEAEKLVQNKLEGDLDKSIKLSIHRLHLLEEFSRFDEAEEIVSRIRETIQNNSLDKISLILGYIGIGFYEDVLGNYQESIDTHLSAIDIIDSVEEEQLDRELIELSIRVRNNLGVSYRQLGQPSKAMEQYERTMEEMKQFFGENYIELSTGYNNMGSIYYTQGDIGRAAEYFVRASRIIEFNLGSTHRRIGAPLNNAGLSFYILGEFDKAAEYLERAQRVKEATYGENHIETAVGYSNLASIHLQNADFSAAERNYNRSIEVRKNLFGSNHPVLIEPIISLGQFYMIVGEYDKARANYEEAINIGVNRLGEAHPNVAESHYQIGRSYMRQGKYEKALPNLQKAFKLLYGDEPLAGNFDVNRQISDPTKLIDILYQIGVTHQNINTDNRSLANSLIAFEWASDLVDHLQKIYKNEASKLTLIDTHYSIYTSAIEVLFDLYSKTGDPYFKREIFKYTERSRSRVALEVLQDVSARAFAGVPESVLEKESALNQKITNFKQELQLLEQEGDDPTLLNSIRDSLFYSQREIENFTSDLEKNYPDYFRLKYDLSLISIEQLMMLLDPDQTFLSYVVSEESIYALIVSKDRFEVEKLTFSGDLANKVNTLRSDVKTGNTEGYMETAYSLYESLVLPIEEFLTSTLIISSDQMLHYLPFELLLTETIDHGHYHQFPYLLMEKEISYAPSATMLSVMKSRKEVNPKNLLAIAPFGEVTSSGHLREEAGSAPQPFSPLILSEYETQTISKIIGSKNGWRDYFSPNTVTILDNANATKSEFLGTQFSNYSFIHFATHAFINESSPALSGIALYPEDSNDGITYLGDIYNMNMSADLIVLGACDTGLGRINRGEGVIGFTRAFIYAGASNLAVSLWRVNDQPTATLMIEFYRHIKAGDSYAASLRKAKLALINEPSMAAPRNWAAFVLHGN